MFLVPFNKKHNSDSTLSSQPQQQPLNQQQQQQQQQETDYKQQSIYDTKSTTTISDALQLKPENYYTHKRQEQQQKRLPHLHRSLIHFIIGTTNLVNKIFIESLASFRRCLHISLRTILTLLNSITAQCTDTPSIVLGAGGGSSGNFISDTDSIRFVTRPTGLAEEVCGGPLVGDSSSSSYLQAIAEASIWSKAAAEAIGRANDSSKRNDTIYYDTIKPQSRSTIEALANNSEPYQCDTIEMDFCRRRITQRAASNDHHHATRAPTNTTACYWDYQTPPSAPSSAQTCTSVGGLLVSGENKAIESCRQLRREQEQQQLGPQFQGQQRSYGLQMEMGDCRREQTQKQQQQQIMLLQQHQQQKLQRSNHDIQIPKSSKYSTCVAQSSSSTSSSSASASFMSVHHQHNHNQQGSSNSDSSRRNASMNSNAHNNSQQLQDHSHHKHQQEQEQKQQYHHQQQGLSRGPQDAATQKVQNENGGASMILVSKETISNLTDQIALSMDKMKDLEERVRVIPELQRRLDCVISDSNSSSVSDSNHHLAHISSAIGAGGRNNNNFNISNYHHNNHQFNHHHNRQDFSFSTDNIVPPYHSDGCNSNSASQQISTNNRTTNSDEIFRGTNPSFQRQYNSFRCSTNGNNNRTRDVNCFSSSFKDSISAAAAQKTAGNFSFRSPLNGSRDFNCNGSVGGIDANGLTNSHHINNASRQSLPIANSSNNMLQSNQNLNNTNRSSSPKVEYEDLINDLISLSYSVNYPSSNTSLSQVHSLNGKRSDSYQANKEHQLPSKSTSEQQDNQQASKRSSPSVSKLDCGCQSFKEHIRYNSISREQRMQHARSHSASYTSATSNILTASPQSTPKRNITSISSKKDASTNTDLSMVDIVTKVELNNLITSMQKTYSTLSSIASRDEETTPIQFKGIARKSSSFASESTSGSMSGPKSSSPLDSRSDSCDEEQVKDNDDDEDIERELSDLKSGFSSNKGSVDENDNPRLKVSDDEEEDDNDEVEDEDDDEEEEEEEEEAEANNSNAESLNGDGPYSLGSSYQDPSDFEEYCAYGESLDRRTKDFMSQSTKIPNDLRFALIRLNDFIKRNRSHDQIESSSGCIEVIRKEWFEVSATKDSQPAKTKLYVDYFESFNKQLLNTVVNLCDNAGNTAMHYAASLYKLDIIKVLLDTKVCDVNCRNKAGYTPIMLLALTDIKTPDDQEVARHLFSMGDVNIKARMSGQTAIMLAASHGRISTCKLLLEAGADPSLQDYDGSTALMCGSEIGNEEVVKCLLGHKLTDPNAVDNDGLDALNIAMNNGHKNIGLILYAAKNVPRMVRSTVSSPLYSNTSGYLGASLRRSRAKLANNYIRRADSLLGSRSSRLMKPHSQT